MTDGAGQGRGSVSQEAVPRPRSFATLLVLAVCAALACAGFTALGTWQLQRLQWKLALIERVEQRVHAVPVAAPGSERWPLISAESDEYRHVRLSGSFMNEKSVLVQAATELGSGYWLLTPLRVADGSDAIVLVNRGFIPSEAAAGVRQAIHDGPADQEQATTVTGLLRLSEPGGAFLRHNDPAAERWYSRDVQAIAAARGLRRIAPYFIDADAEPARADARLGGIAPVSGLTVVSFHNSHLVYALTWYALALMAAAAGLWIWREERRLRRGG